jgi:hypothetical protein
MLCNLGLPAEHILILILLHEYHIFEVHPLIFGLMFLGRDDVVAGLVIFRLFGDFGHDGIVFLQVVVG